MFSECLSVMESQDQGADPPLQGLGLGRPLHGASSGHRRRRDRTQEWRHSRTQHQVRRDHRKIQVS